MIEASVKNADTDDSSLIRKAQEGDTEAFGSLLEKYMKQSYYTALGLVGSNELALDICQDAFTRAFDARGTIDPDRPFFPWIYQIVRRLSFNMKRDRRTAEGHRQATAHWLIARGNDRAARSDPERNAHLAELRGRLEMAIESLPDHEREVFILREFQELRYREIAQIVEIPAGTVMSRLYSARQRLARILEEDR